jgi:hypothetical protein
MLLLSWLDLDYIMRWLFKKLIWDVSHLILSNLTSDCEWKLSNKSNISRYLVMSDLSLAVFQEIICWSFSLLFKFNPSTQFFSHKVIIHSNYLDICNIRMLHEVFLNFHRINILTTSDDHILKSAYDLQEPVFVKLTKITSLNPPFAIYSIFGLLCIIPVSRHYKVASCANFSCLSPWHDFSSFRVSNLDFSKSLYPSYSSWFLLEWVSGFTHSYNGRALSLTIAMSELLNLEFISYSHHQSLWNSWSSYESSS